jgi:hypothetical protein
MGGYVSRVIKTKNKNQDEGNMIIKYNGSLCSPIS